MAKLAQKLQDKASQYLEPGEHYVVGIRARPAGTTKKVGRAIGGMGALGAVLASADRRPDGAAIPMASSMVLGVTPRRLLVFEVGGFGGVTQLLASLPLTSVTMSGTRGALTKQFTLSVDGVPYSMETTWADPVGDFAAALGTR